MTDVLNFCKENPGLTFLILFFGYCTVNTIMRHISYMVTGQNKDERDN